MYNKKFVSVVIATYREKKSIKKVIDEFFKVKYVDEVIVVDNNAESGTVNEVRKTKARLIFEKKQGHGYALRRGMRNTKGDYIILCEADGTFNPQDVIKLLAYGERFPVVLGTRTNTSSIGQKTAMFFLRRIADVFEGKLIQLLFLSHSISDVGCTYKLLQRDIAKKMDRQWTTGDSHFITEFTLQIVARRIPFIEIPVDFRKRVGESAVTGDLYSMTKWGFKLFFFIFYFWSRWLLGKLFRIPHSKKFHINLSS